MNKRIPVYAHDDAALRKELNERVNAYFEEKGISKNGDWRMVSKTITQLGLVALAYGAILKYGPEGGWGAVWLWPVLGFFIALIGMNIGHDAIHGSYTGSDRLNKILGGTFDVMGARSKGWFMQHNILHHTFTNVPGWDGDIDPTPLIRMHKGTKRYFFHSIQHFYWPIIYIWTTVAWLVAKDFEDLFKPDPRNGLKKPWTDWIGVILAKASHFFIFVGVPAAFGVPLWPMVIGYMMFHWAIGLTLAVVFQCAHVLEGPELVTLEEGEKMPGGFAFHQLRTTGNFSAGNPIATWFVGGLNHQVEHHLFPKICHVHYPQLAPIVKEVALKHGAPYNEYPSFLGAVAAHVRYLRTWGKGLEKEGSNELVYAFSSGAEKPRP
jgi:linoleoyl-CoA desaturase